MFEENLEVIQSLGFLDRVSNPKFILKSSSNDSNYRSVKDLLVLMLLSKYCSYLKHLG